MTDNEIRIAIAEKCRTLDGWYCGRCRERKQPYANETICPDCGTDLHRDSPNYPTDLNAMHEAESAIPENLTWKYYSELSQVTLKARKDGKIMLARVRATARQRAEAFLRTFGLWKKQKDSQ